MIFLMQAMLSDSHGRVLIIEPGIGYKEEHEQYSLITNYSLMKPEKLSFTNKVAYKCKENRNLNIHKEKRLWYNTEY